MTRRAHAMPFGAEVTAEGVRFALWAPTAREVALVTGDGGERPMPDAGEGWRRLLVPGTGPGTRYGFRIDGDLVVPDPASRFQPEDVGALSLVVDPGTHHWADADWAGRPWEEAVVYEAHVGTATREGTYAALGDRLEALRDLGVTAVELLPLADFPGARNWGYDGVLPFAPDAAYGTPDELRRFVERAHGLGLMVLIDVVYNHFGPSGNYLNAYAKSFFTERHQTPWGAGINFDGRESGQTVRDFFVHNALYWLEEFNVDGLRFDAVHAILDDSERHIIAELAERVRAALPHREHVHLVLENDANQARWLPRHDAVDDVSARPRLHTAQWNDDLHHCWHVLLADEAGDYYVDYADRPVARLARCLAEGFAYQGEASTHRKGEVRGEPSGHLPPSAFVTFLQNHDQVGNRALGERIGHLVPAERLALARAFLLLCPQIPMLYMGEEWAASSPFLYFVDFAGDTALSDAVREGRRREFAGLFAHVEDVPDPTDPETFARSKLDWAERENDPFRGVLDEVRALLTLRREHVVPLTRGAYRGAVVASPAADASEGDRTLDVTWRYARGRLRAVANFGDAPLAVSDPGTRLWAGPRAFEGAIPPWCGCVWIEAAQ